MRKTKTLKAQASQITYIQIGERFPDEKRPLPNLAFAFSVEAGVVHIYQTQPSTYTVKVHESG